MSEEDDLRVILEATTPEEVILGYYVTLFYGAAMTIIFGAAIYFLVTVHPVFFLIPIILVFFAFFLLS